MITTYKRFPQVRSLDTVRSIAIAMVGAGEEEGGDGGEGPSLCFILYTLKYLQAEGKYELNCHSMRQTMSCLGMFTLFAESVYNSVLKFIHKIQRNSP